MFERCTLPTTADSPQGGACNPYRIIRSPFLEVRHGCRRNEILEGLKGLEEAQQILEKYPIANLNHTLLSFVASARAALGPNMLKVASCRLLRPAPVALLLFQAPVTDR
jgi:hypothetical protein